MAVKINFEDKCLNKYGGNQLRKIADYRVRKYLLSRSSRCFLTGKDYHPSELHVSHYIDRNRVCHRWDLNNVHLINKWSNLFDAKVFNKALYGRLSKHHFEYRNKLIETYGIQIVVELEHPCQRQVWSKNKLIKIIETLC